MRLSSNQSSEYVSLLHNSDLQKSKNSLQNTISSKIKTTSTFFNVFQSNQFNQNKNQSSQKTKSFNKDKFNFNGQSNTENSSIAKSIKNEKPRDNTLKAKKFLRENQTENSQYGENIKQHELIRKEKYNFSPFYGRSKSNEAHLLDSDDKKQIKKLKTKNAQLQSTIVNLRFKNEHLKNKYEQLKKQNQKNIERFQQNKKLQSSKKKEDKGSQQIMSQSKINSQVNQFYVDQRRNQIQKQLLTKNYILEDTNRQLNQKIEWLNDILKKEKEQLKEYVKQIRLNNTTLKQKEQQHLRETTQLRKDNTKLNQEKQHYLEIISDMENKVAILNQQNTSIIKHTNETIKKDHQVIDQCKKQIQQLTNQLHLSQTTAKAEIQKRESEIKQLKKLMESQIEQIYKKQGNSTINNKLLVQREILLQERLIISQQETQNLKNFVREKQLQLSQLSTTNNQQKMFMLQQYKNLQQQFTSSALFFKNKINTLQKQNQKVIQELKKQKFNFQSDKRLFQNKIIYELKKQNQNLRDQNMYYRCGYNHQQISYYRQNYAKSLQKNFKSKYSNPLKKSMNSQMRYIQLQNRANQIKRNAQQKKLIKFKAFKNKLQDQKSNHRNQDNNFSSSFEQSRQKIKKEKEVIPICISSLNPVQLQNQSNSDKSLHLSNFDKKQKQIEERYQNFMKLLKLKFSIGKDTSN